MTFVHFISGGRKLTEEKREKMGPATAIAVSVARSGNFLNSQKGRNKSGPHGFSDTSVKHRVITACTSTWRKRACKEGWKEGKHRSVNKRKRSGRQRRLVKSSKRRGFGAACQICTEGGWRVPRWRSKNSGRLKGDRARSREGATVTTMDK